MSTVGNQRQGRRTGFLVTALKCCKMFKNISGYIQKLSEQIGNCLANREGLEYGQLIIGKIKFPGYCSSHFFTNNRQHWQHRKEVGIVAELERLGSVKMID